MRSELVAFLALAVSACSDDSKPTTPPLAEPTVILVPGDGGVSSTAIVAGTGVDPSSMHLDSVDTHRPAPSQPGPARERRPIDVTMRSTPPGARVAVDGIPVGITPAFWNGFADGREHEFVFTLPGHAIARYRFVPVSSGVIHARLEPVVVERDAGVLPPPEVVPHPAPSAVVPPSPPPTIVTPAPPPPATPDAAVPAPAAPSPPSAAVPGGSAAEVNPSFVPTGTGPQP